MRGTKKGVNAYSCMLRPGFGHVFSIQKLKILHDGIRHGKKAHPLLAHGRALRPVWRIAPHAAATAPKLEVLFNNAIQ